MPFFLLLVSFFNSLFRSKHQLVIENLALRQQVFMLRKSVKKPRPSVADKLFWIIFSRYVDGWRKLLHGLHPDTVVRWHRQGFRLYWRWKSRGQKPGRPPIDTALRNLIREMQATNHGLGCSPNPWGTAQIGYRYLSSDSLKIYDSSEKTTFPDLANFSQ